MSVSPCAGTAATLRMKKTKKLGSVERADGTTIKIKPHRGSSLDTSLGNEVNSPTIIDSPNKDITSFVTHTEDSLAKHRRADFARANTLPN